MIMISIIVIIISHNIVKFNSTRVHLKLTQRNVLKWQQYLGGQQHFSTMDSNSCRTDRKHHPVQHGFYMPTIQLQLVVSVQTYEREPSLNIS